MEIKELSLRIHTKGNGFTLEQLLGKITCHCKGLCVKNLEHNHALTADQIMRSKCRNMRQNYAIILPHCLFAFILNLNTIGTKINKLSHSRNNFKQF